MATSESKRKMEHRRKSYDRFACVIDKGGKEFLRVVALRDNTTMSDMLRQAVLAKAGLRMLPYPDELEKLTKVSTPAAANIAILCLQAREESSEYVQSTITKLENDAHRSAYKYIMHRDDIAGFGQAVNRSERDDLSSAFSKVLDAIDKKAPNDEEVIFTAREIGIIRRFVANLKPIGES